MEVPEDLESFVMAQSQSARSGSQSSSTCDIPAFTSLPEAPDAPLDLSLAPGVNDGIWKFSMEKNNHVVLILPVALQPPHESGTKQHWPLWLHNLLMGNGKQISADEHDSLLPAFQTAVNAGWRIAKGSRIISRFLPLPEEDPDLLTSTDESQSFFPPSRFPHDILDSLVQLDSARGIQSPIRSYRAIARQRDRRISKEKESQDLILLKARPTAERRLPVHPRTDSSKQLSQTIAERSESKAIRKAGPSYLSRRRGSRRRIQHRPTTLMIQPKDSTDDDMDPVGSQPIAHRNLKAYVESVASEDGAPLTKANLERKNDMGSENSPPSSPNGSTSVKQPYSRLPSPHHPKRGKNRTTATIETNNHGSEWNLSMANPRRVSGRHAKNIKKPISGASKSKGVNFTEGANAGDSTDSGLESWDQVYSDETSPSLSSTSFANSERSNSDDDRSVVSHDSIASEQRARLRKQYEEEMQASRREMMRENERRWRDLKRQQRVRRPSVLVRRNPNDLSWFWVCQMDIIPGYWATPWTMQFKPLVSLGTTAVILEALLGLTDDLSLQYRSVHQEGTWSWLREGKTTFPPYARNARGGVIVDGSYGPVSFDAFEQKLPPIQLPNCYDYQVSKIPRVDDISILGRQLELMAIDCWLSAAGRTTEIMDGAANLL